MQDKSKYLAVRFMPVALVCIAAAFWFADVQQDGPWVARNLMPLAVLLGLSFVTLRHGGGRWSGAGMRMPLGTLGFAIPALGLTDGLPALCLFD
jgi:hypothetical protein